MDTHQLHFDRLRLNGFKSFVDPTDLVIREGLTGVVGPNGCGKSNLLEALRWVMGENRPSAMRGSGMEDVIFAGSDARTARAHAEVALTIDNRARLAPAGMNDSDTLEITRRITRDAGSAYRINGRDVRARDVQMLFADASTGAHSPALVRQGQISELINAKPKARRRILEEAAGISGLYQRRHEAELKLNGAEQNLARVDDTLTQLDAQAASLARQARAAARYREIGTALRLAERQALWRRWAEAEAQHRAASDALRAATTATAEAEARARKAVAARMSAESALPPLREETQIANAVLARATTAREAVDAAESRARATAARLVAELARLDKDIARESALNRDAAETLAGLQAEREGLDKAQSGHGDRLTAATNAADEAAQALQQVEARLSHLQAEAARLSAQAQAAERLVTDLRQMRDRAARAATEAESRAKAAAAEVAQAEAALSAAQEAQDTATRAVDAAESRLAEAETARTRLEAMETRARTARAEAEGESGALRAERDALARLVERGRSGGQAVLDRITVAPGWEAALAAALGDDLRAPVTEDGAGWRDLAPLPTPAPLPEGAEPLSPHVSAPPPLTRRLSQTGVVADAATGARLQAALQPGQRLVSKAGDLWRWDGFALPAGTGDSQAARHLQQVNRLKALEAQAAEAQTRADVAITAHEAARQALRSATTAEAEARDARRRADTALTDTARAATRAESARTLALARAEQMQAEQSRHRADESDAATRLITAEAALADLPDRAATATAVEDAKTGVEAARIATLSRRAALDELRRDGQARSKRLQEIAGETGNWQNRLDQAGARAAELTARRDTAALDLAEAEAQPAQLAASRAQLAEDEAAAATRLTRARAAMEAAEAALRDATDTAREAARAASGARESRAGTEARADATRDSLDTACARILEEAETTPEALAEELGPDIPPLATLESDIARLRATRESLGAVNLRADEDKRALEEERDQLDKEKTDLTEAIRKLRGGIGSLNREGRERLLAAFETVNRNFATLFTHLFGGGEARLTMVESDDPLDAGLEILCQPPGKRLATLSLLSGGEQTLTALALIFAVFLANPAPICVLDEVDAPLDDANVTRFCDLMDEMARRTETRFLVITHHAVTMARMDRLFGVTMVEQGVSQLVSVDLRAAEALVA